MMPKAARAVIIGLMPADTSGGGSEKRSPLASSAPVTAQSVNWSMTSVRIVTSVKRATRMVDTAWMSPNRPKYISTEVTTATRVAHR